MRIGRIAVAAHEQQKRDETGTESAVHAAIYGERVLESSWSGLALALSVAFVHDLFEPHTVPITELPPQPR